MALSNSSKSLINICSRIGYEIRGGGGGEGRGERRRERCESVDNVLKETTGLQKHQSAMWHCRNIAK